MSKQKLELTWIGKNNPEYDIANIEPRILEERMDLSYGDPNTENMIIHGDNLLVLKALLPEYEGKIKCIYIDPPYNTGNAFEHYDDSVEHSTWLSLMKPRLELLKMLLHHEQGSIWISIDDDETHYLKVLCDEIFGRNNFVANVIWEKKFSPQNDTKWLSDSHDHILVYARNKEVWRPNLLPRTDDMDARYKNPDNDPRGIWTSSDLTAKRVTEKDIYPIKAPSGKIFMPTKGRSWGVSKDKIKELIIENRVWFGEDGNNMPRLKRFLSEVQDGSVSKTIWYRTEVGDNQEAKREIKIFDDNDVFATPKPERLVKRILTLASKEGDWVLDSFLGSGTSAAVAHKMKRNWIGIEMGEHAYSHVHKRMKKVVDGTDGLKLSEALGWTGGGGFKFYELAPSFVTIDEFGNPVIDSHYNDTKLIRAMCKLMNYTFSPSPSDYWRQGKGQGNNSIYVTTQMLSVAMVQQIVSHLSINETLLICPKKYEPGCEKVDGRITIKKIPQSILKACHFGKKEYLLPIKERAIEEIDEEEVTDDEE
ncbi:MAG: site-specific DNA-methyltransferase [Candidatus Omnitrophica bacterium]|nr:site-specific DNA-methyltransferase [Candidatus Omnitrophota bacterium]